jgi:hypothetical protein
VVVRQLHQRQIRQFSINMSEANMQRHPPFLRSISALMMRRASLAPTLRLIKR